METIRKILTRQEVKNILRIKADSSLQDMINAGKFPKGFKIGLRRVGWYEDEVLAWLKSARKKRAERWRNGVRRNVMNITKSAPLPECPCEQLTCCEKNGLVQWNYINRVTKRHNCRITGKTKAPPATVAPRHKLHMLSQRMSIANNATFAAGGQSVTEKNSGGATPALWPCGAGGV